MFAQELDHLTSLVSPIPIHLVPLEPLSFDVCMNLDIILCFHRVLRSPGKIVAYAMALSNVRSRFSFIVVSPLTNSGVR